MPSLLLLALAGGTLFLITRKPKPTAASASETPSGEKPTSGAPVGGATETKEVKTEGPMTLADVEARYKEDAAALLDAFKKSGAKLPDEITMLSASPTAFAGDDQRPDALVMGLAAFGANTKDMIPGDTAASEAVRKAAAKIAIDYRDKFVLKYGGADSMNKGKRADAVLAAGKALGPDPKNDTLMRAYNDAIVALVKDTDAQGYSDVTVEENATPEADFDGKKVKVSLNAIYDIDGLKAEREDPKTKKVRKYLAYLGRVTDKASNPLKGEYPVVYAPEKAAETPVITIDEKSKDLGLAEKPTMATVTASFKKNLDDLSVAMSALGSPLPDAYRAALISSLTGDDLRATAFMLNQLFYMANTAKIADKVTDPSKVPAARAAAERLANDLQTKISIENGFEKAKLVEELKETSKTLALYPTDATAMTNNIKAFVKLVNDTTMTARGEKKIEEDPTPTLIFEGDPKFDGKSAKVSLEKIYALKSDAFKPMKAFFTTGDKIYNPYLAKVIDPISAIDGKYPIVYIFDSMA